MAALFTLPKANKNYLRTVVKFLVLLLAVILLLLEEFSYFLPGCFMIASLSVTHFGYCYVTS